MIRIGLVGAGPWAGLFHAPLIAASPDFDLVGVWARRPEAAAALAGEYGAQAFESYRELLDNCEAMSFAVPPDVQPQLAVAAARAGKHLLLDKPVGRTVEDARAVRDAALEAGVASLLMLRFRFTRTAEDFLAHCAASTVRSVVGEFVAGGVLPGSVFATPWRVGEPHALLDLGPHTFDLVEAAAGPITRLDATAAGGVLHVNAHHASGGASTIVLSAVTPNSSGALRCVAVTDSGRFELGDTEGESVFETIAHEFAAAVRGERPARVGVERGLLLQRLIAATAASLAAGALVDFAG